MTENPILEAADKIKVTTQQLINEDFQDIFPKNYSYRCGNYNSIFIPMKGFGEHGGGFFRQADMVVLTRTGEFKSGLVKQTVADDHTCWEFFDARLVQADGLTVVKYSPRLILDLFKQLEDEYVEFEEPERIEKAIKALPKRAEVAQEIIAISREALIEMGEDNPEIPSGEKDYGIAIMPMLNEIFAELNPVCTPSFQQREAAFNYFKRREDLKTEVSNLCSVMRVKSVEEWFSELTAKMVSDNVFPITHQDKDDSEWYYPDSPHDGTYRIRSSHSSWGGAGRDADLWTWGISKSGDVREIKDFSRSTNGSLITQRCAEHLLQDGPAVASALVAKVASQFFPKLKVGIF